MLKTLEEPPEYVVIILITSNEEKLLNTIKSRCMKIVFNAIENKKIYLKIKELLEIEPNENIISKSMGSLGKAIQMQKNIDIYNKIDQLLQNMKTEDLITIINNADVMYSQKECIIEILDYIIVYLYNSKAINMLNCVKYVEQTKRRINANSNYDMCIDYLLMNMYKTANPEGECK